MKSLSLLLLSLCTIGACKKTDVPHSDRDDKVTYYIKDSLIRSNGMVPMSQAQYEGITPIDQSIIDGLYTNGRMAQELQTESSLHLPPVINQRDIPGSAAFAAGYAVKSFNLWRQVGGSYFVHSSGFDTTLLFNPLFIYNQLDISKRQNLWHVFEFMKTKGSSTMHNMPFFYDRDTTRQPSQAAQDAALNSKIAAVYKLKEFDITKIKKIVSEYKYPIVVGVTIDNAFKRMAAASFIARNTYDTGSHYKTYIWKRYMQPGDQSDNIAFDLEKSLHTMVIAGYSDVRNAFLVWNSWGILWGNEGYIWVDYEFMKEALYYMDSNAKPLNPYAFILAEKKSWKDGLVAAFPFNQNTDDISGYGNHGIVSANVTFDTDRKGDPASHSIKFKGSSAPGNFRVPNAASLQFSEEASVSFWIRIDGVDGTDWGGTGPNTVGDFYVIYNFFSKSGRVSGGSSDSNFDGLASFGKVYASPFWGGNMPLTTFFYGGAIGNYARPENGWQPTQAGQWHHIVNVFRKNGMSSLYINGRLTSEREIGVFFDKANQYDFVFNQFYKMEGAMDDIYIYNSALGDKEVAALYRR